MISEHDIEVQLAKLQAKDLLRRGYKVQRKARSYLSGAEGHPRRIDTGDLRSSIGVTLITAGGARVRIGTNRKKAVFVHRGTGLYGPRHQLIRPRHAKVLRFRVKGGGVVFVRFTRGMRPNHFLTDALKAAKD